MNPTPAARRTQEERSATTRARLLDATIECLFEEGYARTTTTGIARRAGLSRGAQLHHFPTKAELVIHAVDHLINRRRDEFVQRFSGLPAGVNRIAAAIDLLWEVFSGPTFLAWLELMVAARTDDELRPVVTDLSRRFAETVQATFLAIFPRPPGAAPLYDIGPQFAFALLQGLALEKDVLDPPARVAQVLDTLKQLGALAIGTNP